MKFSEQWLREWVNPPVQTHELAEQLTMAGLEVEAVTRVAPELEGVIVGRVITVEPHPETEKLHICKVDVGGKKPLKIVCGAPDVRADILVPVACIGALLPGEVGITKAKILGVESEGMLCSTKELGLTDSADGLMLLDDDLTPGSAFDEALNLHDASIELSLTPNRGDCLSIAGVAREVAVINKCSINAPTMASVFATTNMTMSVNVEAPEACPHYFGRILYNINPNARSPVWLQERLRRSGLRSLGPVVDVTNYIMLELGQPMHAFDLKTIKGGITVRFATKNEKLTLLDGQKIKLSKDVLVIADDDKALAMAGIMGGEGSGVNRTTQSILLESAFFTPGAIAGRARQYGLHTDSSHRFERGVDPDIQRTAIERATSLLLEIVGGEAGAVIEASDSDHVPQRETIRLRAEQIKRVLGMEIPRTEVTDILTRLGMDVSEHMQAWEVTPPLFRFDIEQEVDLIEEIGRIHGYQHLPGEQPHTRLVMEKAPETENDLTAIRQIMVDRGYHEAITYSFVDSKLQRLLEPDLATVTLANPIASEMADMRTSLWPGLLQVLKYNVNRQQDRVRIFECGLKYLLQDNDIKEENVLSAMMTGPVEPENWRQGHPAESDFFHIKSDVEALLALTGQPKAFIFTPTTHPALHPGQTADIGLEGELVGRIGALHPGILQEIGIAGQVFAFEINLLSIKTGKLPKFQELSKFPSIRRDLAIVIDNSVNSQAVRDCITTEVGENLQNLQLFDMYTGKGIDSGRKSLGLGLILQATSHTLKDSEVDTVIERVVSRLGKDFGATLRK